MLRHYNPFAILRIRASASPRSRSTNKSGADRRGPVRKMIERFCVRGVEVQRSDGDGSGKNRRVIRVRLHILVDSLLEQPKITPSARIFSFAELVARNLLRLPREFHAAVPRLRHIHVEQDLIRQSFFQNQFRGSPSHARRIFKFHFRFFRAQRHCYGWNVMQRALTRRAHGTGVIDIFPEISAVVDSGNHHVRFFRQEFVQRHDHAIRRRPVDGPFPLRDPVAHDRLPQRQRLRCPAALQARRNNTYGGETLQASGQRAQPFRLISVVVRQKYVRHWQMFPMFCFLEIIRVGGLPLVAVRGGRSVFEEEMVGTTGFEPATSRTPSVRATRLRYVPTGKLTATGQGNQKAESGRESAPPRYHRRSSSVKKARSVSRRSSSILRLRSCAEPSPARLAPMFSSSRFPSCSR